jgi:glycerol kinase
MARYVGAVDQGTTSTRFMVFDKGGNEISRHQLEHQQILPQPGWVEHDPLEIAARTDEVIARAMRNANITAEDLAAIGVTNQRETTIVWNPKTGRPWYNAIVWQDTRTDRIVNALSEAQDQMIRSRTGLPPATYFSGAKIQWILDNVPGVREAAGRGEAVFGNADTWVIWNLTGGKDGGVHATDVTNASRTMLMNLKTLAWDDELLAIFNVPRAMLPSIQSSSDRQAFGVTRRDGPVGGEVPVAGDLGDQQAATVGQVCTRPGEAKNTYGTGNFMLLNTGTQIVPSKAGLLTTVCYRMGKETIYALEGSIAVTGSAVQWAARPAGDHRVGVGDRSARELGAGQRRRYFVPAFSGLFAPYWRSGRARRDRRAVALQHQGAPGARHAGSDLLPDARRPRRDGPGLRRPPRAAEGRRRRHRQRLADAAPGRRPRRPRRPPGRRRDDGVGRGLCGRPRGWLLEGSGRHASELAHGQALGAALVRRPARRGLRWLGESGDENARLGLRGEAATIQGSWFEPSLPQQSSRARQCWRTRNPHRYWMLSGFPSMS